MADTNIIEELKALLAGKLDAADVPKLEELLAKLPGEEAKVAESAPVKDEEGHPDEMADKVMLSSVFAKVAEMLKSESAAAPAIAGDEEAPKKPDDGAEKPGKEKADLVSKAAMDAAIQSKIASALATDRKRAAAEVQAIRVAEREVRPVVGDLEVACDSANAVYAAALKLRGVNVTGVPPEAYRAMWDLAKANVRSEPDVVAMDSKSEAALLTAFPHANRL